MDAFSSPCLQREILFCGDIPANLENERKLIVAEFDRTQGKIGNLNPKKDAKQLEELLGRLAELRTNLREIAERIRKVLAKVRGACITRSHWVWSGHRRRLDSGTLMLTYSIGKDNGFLFVVSGDTKRGPPLSVFSLPVGEKALRESVEAFRTLIEWSKPAAEIASPEPVALRHAAQAGRVADPQVTTGC